MFTLKPARTSRLRKVTVAALAALVLAAGLFGATLHGTAEQVAKKGSFDITFHETGAAEVAKKGSFDITFHETGAAELAKVNEYEGQHRVAA